MVAIATIPLTLRCSVIERKTEQAMNRMSKGLLLSAAAVMLAATTASAAIVCNEDGDCWRVQGEPRYEPSLRLRIMPDDWRWEESDRRYRWREPGKGRGYWRGEKWIEIEVEPR
jgi:hypothetical protein